jgi:hypothetical protein
LETHARGLPGKNRKGFNIKLLPLQLTSGLILTQANAAAADLTMALGGFDVSKEATAIGQVEYRFSTDWSGLRPQAGLFATADSGVYVYAGLGDKNPGAETASLS